MEAASCFETLVNIYQAVWRHVEGSESFRWYFCWL